MKRIALIAALLAVTAARAQNRDRSRCLDASRRPAGKLDTRRQNWNLQGAQGPLDGYERYYRGTKRSGRLFVEGYFGSFQTKAKLRIPAICQPTSTSSPALRPA